jgi:hypothetical protein
MLPQRFQSLTYQFLPHMGNIALSVKLAFPNTNIVKAYSHDRLVGRITYVQ